MREFAVLLLLFLVTGCGAMSPEATATASSQTVSLGDSVTLSAAGSDQKNGETLTYHWSIVSAPAGSTANISNPASAEPAFTPDLTGEYVFQLVVDNDWHKSEPVQVKITCTPAPILPVPNATDPSGLISLQDLTAVENFRNATDVNFSIACTFDNATSNRVNVGVTIKGLDGAGAEVFSRLIETGIPANTAQPLTVSFGEALTHAQYDSIVDWSADSIILY